MSTPSKDLPNKIGIVLMTYGSATTAEHVESYLNHIYKRQAPAELIEDFANRYRLVGGSPLIDITHDQALKLERELNEHEGSIEYVVRAGMLHSAPFIVDSVGELRAAGATNVTGIILSPQFSSFIMEGYRLSLVAAAMKHGYRVENVTVADPWPTESKFIELLANRTTSALERLEAKYGISVPVVFTTHSLPERVVAKDPTYLTQLAATTEAVVARIKDPRLRWSSAYQSAGHSPEPWLKPDLVDVLAKIRDEGGSSVLIVPVQFLADHLEILYDLDIAAREQCDEYGIVYHRIALPNTDPLFIEALADVIAKSSGLSSSEIIPKPIL